MGAEEDHGTPLKRSEATFDGPVGRKRKCTDFLFLLLLVATWVAMTGIGLAAMGIIKVDGLSKGNPDRLLNGMDYHGNVCGVTNYVTPNGNDTIDLPHAYFLPSGMAVCVESCPNSTNFDQYHCKYEVQADIDRQVGMVRSARGDEAADTARQSLYLMYTADKQCMPLISTRSYLGYCQPSDNMDEVQEEMNHTYAGSNITSTNLTIAKEGGGTGSFFDEAMADMLTSRHVIFGFGLGGAILLGVLFLILIQTPGILSILIWSMIAGIFGAFVVGGHYMRQTSIEWREEGLKEENEIKGLYYLSVAAHVAAGLWFFVVCCIRKRIVLAVACVREASRAVSAMPVITLYPVIQVLGLFAFCIPWGVFMVYLASSGEVEAQCICAYGDIFRRLDEDSNMTMIDNVTFIDDGNSTNAAGGDFELIEDDFECDDGCYVYKSFSYSTNTKYAGLFMLFAWFWTSQFIVAVGQLVVAMSISMWYFTREKKAVGNWTFFRAMFIASLYHLGTCAFGSLIIAIIKTIRAMVAYVQKKAAKLNNRVAKVILMAIQCCLWCIEKCLKFINKNAYIQTAIFGYSFCKAAREAFCLIVRNALRISAVSLVGTLVLFIGKVFIVAGAGTGAYFYLDYYYSDQLHGLWVPIVLVCIVSYAAADMFNEVFGMSISTILQCFVADEEMFAPEDRYASGSLASTIDSTQRNRKFSKESIHPEEGDENGDDAASFQQGRRTTVKKQTSFVKRLIPATVS